MFGKVITLTWLDSSLQLMGALLSHNHGRLTKKTIRQLQFVIEQNTDEILRLWINLFGDDIHFDR